MISFFQQYRFLIVPIVVWLAIQSFKVMYDLVVTKKFNFKRILGAGGMPSSHSAVVTSLATMVGKNYGTDSAIFAISVVFACVVMYDAAGVRRAAGKQARVLNQIIANYKEINIQEKLVELLGHTPIEVLVGAVFGVVETLALYKIFCM